MRWDQRSEELIVFLFLFSFAPHTKRDTTRNFIGHTNAEISIKLEWLFGWIVDLSLSKSNFDSWRSSQSARRVHCCMPWVDANRFNSLRLRRWPLELNRKGGANVYLLWVLQLLAQKRVYDYFNENLFTRQSGDWSRFVIIKQKWFGFVSQYRGFVCFWTAFQ